MNSHSFIHTRNSDSACMRCRCPFIPSASTQMSSVNRHTCVHIHTCTLKTTQAWGIWKTEMLSFESSEWMKTQGWADVKLLIRHPTSSCRSDTRGILVLFSFLSCQFSISFNILQALGSLLACRFLSILRYTVFKDSVGSRNVEFGKGQITFVICSGSLMGGWKFKKFPLLQESSALTVLSLAPSLNYSCPEKMNSCIWIWMMCYFLVIFFWGRKLQQAIFFFLIYSLYLVQNWAQLSKYRIDGWMDKYKIASLQNNPICRSNLDLKPCPRIRNEVLFLSRGPTPTKRWQTQFQTNLVPTLTLTAMMRGGLSHKHHRRWTEATHQRQPDARVAPAVLEN